MVGRKKAPAATTSSLEDEPGTTTAANAGNEENVTLNEQSTISTEVDPEASADPGEIKTGLSAAELSPSGSISEKEAVADIPMDHPSVDDNPRKNQPSVANRIDFNDPHNF